MKIVYCSNTGLTKKYAQLLAKSTGLELYELGDALKRLDKNTDIIYMSWLMASTVKNYPKAAKRFNIKAVCAVGLCPTGELIEDIRRVQKLPETLPLFTLQGGMKRRELKGINRFMINMLIKGMTAKKDKTPEDKAMLELLNTGGDLVREENLSAFLEWYNK
jgi:hypothetical protein